MSMSAVGATVGGLIGIGIGLYKEDSALASVLCPLLSGLGAEAGMRFALEKKVEQLVDQYAGHAMGLSAALAICYVGTDSLNRTCIANPNITACMANGYASILLSIIGSLGATFVLYKIITQKEKAVAVNDVTPTGPRTLSGDLKASSQSSSTFIGNVWKYIRG